MKNKINYSFDDFYNIETLKMNDILLTSNKIHRHIFIFYKIKNSKYVHRIMIQILDKQRNIKIHHKTTDIYNPLKLMPELSYIKFNNKNYIKLLSSNDSIIVEMGIIIIINEYSNLINEMLLK